MGSDARLCCGLAAGAAQEAFIWGIASGDAYGTVPSLSHRRPAASRFSRRLSSRGTPSASAAGVVKRPARWGAPLGGLSALTGYTRRLLGCAGRGAVLVAALARRPVRRHWTHSRRCRRQLPQISQERKGAEENEDSGAKNSLPEKGGHRGFHDGQRSACSGGPAGGIRRLLRAAPAPAVPGDHSGLLCRGMCVQCDWQAWFFFSPGSQLLCDGSDHMPAASSFCAVLVAVDSGTVCRPCGEGAFGGLGRTLFNPAAAGVAFVTVCSPDKVFQYIAWCRRAVTRYLRMCTARRYSRLPQ